jgi:hypothetical protein
MSRFPSAEHLAAWSLACTWKRAKVVGKSFQLVPVNVILPYELSWFKLPAL